jgi:hypothetical protein
VKPERIALPPINHFNKAAARRWWHYGGPREALYAAVKRVKRVLATARVSPTNAVAWLPPTIVFHEKLVCFPDDSDWFFAVMQSWLHWEWVRLYTSTLGATTLNYSPSACFETFPFPARTTGLEDAGKRYDAVRRELMRSRREGLTATYNRFHDRAETLEDISALRALHIEMDQAVAAAYGWSDLDLGHGFHETKQGVRYTISESARRTVLDRLLALNHQRYAEEVKAGLHDKGTKKGKRAKASGSAPAQGHLIPPPQGDLFGSLS